MSDDDVVAYVNAARAAGDHDAAVTGIGVLVYGHWHWVTVRLARKLPLHVVEDATGDLIVRALKSTFDGRSVGEFRAWLRTIVDRHIADFHRSRKPEPEPLPGHGLCDDGPAGGELEGISQDGLAETEMVIGEVLDGLSAEHRRVVEIVVLEGGSAADACAAIPGLTPDNAYQIVRRFRVVLRAALDEGPD